MDKRFLIYGLEKCPFCSKVVEFFSEQKLEFLFFELEQDLEFLAEVKEYYNFPTVPIVLENDLATGYTKFIGGCSDLVEYLK